MARAVAVGCCQEEVNFNDYHRFPLPRLPILQPFLQVGMIRFIAPERDEQDKWSHTHWYITPGIGYANRFSKNFEIGVEAAGGISDPSYNMSIDISPGLKY